MTYVVNHFLTLGEAENDEISTAARKLTPAVKNIGSGTSDENLNVILNDILEFLSLLLKNSIGHAFILPIFNAVIEFWKRKQHVCTVDVSAWCEKEELVQTIIRDLDLVDGSVRDIHVAFQSLLTIPQYNKVALFHVLKIFDENRNESWMNFLSSVLEYVDLEEHLIDQLFDKLKSVVDSDHIHQSVKIFAQRIAVNVTRNNIRNYEYLTNAIEFLQHCVVNTKVFVSLRNGSALNLCEIVTLIPTYMTIEPSAIFRRLWRAHDRCESLDIISAHAILMIDSQSAYQLEDFAEFQESEKDKAFDYLVSSMKLLLAEDTYKVADKLNLIYGRAELILIHLDFLWFFISKGKQDLLNKLWFLFIDLAPSNAIRDIFYKWLQHGDRICGIPPEYIVKECFIQTKIKDITNEFMRSFSYYLFDQSCANLRCDDEVLDYLFNVVRYGVIDQILDDVSQRGPTVTAADLIMKIVLSKTGRQKDLVSLSEKMVDVFIEDMFDNPTASRNSVIPFFCKLEKVLSDRVVEYRRQPIGNLMRLRGRRIDIAAHVRPTIDFLPEKEIVINVHESESLYLLGEKIADAYITELGPNWPLPVHLELSRASAAPSTSSSPLNTRTPQVSMGVENTLDDWETWPSAAEPSPNVSPISVEVQLSPRADNTELNDFSGCNVIALARPMKDGEARVGWNWEGKVSASTLPTTRLAMKRPDAVSLLWKVDGGAEVWKLMPILQTEGRSVEEELVSKEKIVEGLLSVWTSDGAGGCGGRLLYRQLLSLTMLSPGLKPCELCDEPMKGVPQERWRRIIEETKSEGLDEMIAWLLNVAKCENIPMLTRLPLESNVLLVIYRIVEEIRPSGESSSMSNGTLSSVSDENDIPSSMHMPLTSESVGYLLDYCLIKGRALEGYERKQDAADDDEVQNRTDVDKALTRHLVDFINRNISETFELISKLKEANLKAFYDYATETSKSFAEFMFQMNALNHTESVKLLCFDFVVSLLDDVSEISPMPTSGSSDEQDGSLESIWEHLLEIVTRDTYNKSTDCLVLKMMNHILLSSEENVSKAAYGENVSSILKSIQWICIYGNEQFDYTNLEILLNCAECLLKRMPMEVFENIFECLKDTVDNLLNTVYALFLEDKSGRLTQPRFYPVVTRNRIFRFIEYLIANSYKLATRVCYFITKNFHTYSEDIPAGVYYSEFGTTVSRMNPVGLFNGGSTCYLNSVLQQLFHVPRLKQLIMEIDFKSAPSITKDNERQKVRVLWELQKVFIFLNRKYVSVMRPDWFWRTFRFGSRPLSLSNQEDACEFLSILMDNIDEAIQALGLSVTSRKFFGGDFVISTKCSNCQIVSSQTDPFLYLAVGVRTTIRLNLALFELFEEEKLEKDNAYHCESCRSLTSAVRWSLLKTLPHNLAIQLKRFEFTNRTIKYNNYFEFPEVLDMAMYLQDDQELCLDGEVLKPPYPTLLYRLRGYVVHSGIAAGGHYFSIIKSGNKWLKFNDDVVTEYSGEHNQYFGSMNNDSYQPNAYLLFYERIVEEESAAIPKEKIVTRKSTEPAGYMLSQISSQLRRAVNLWPEHHLLIYKLLHLKTQSACQGGPWDHFIVTVLIDLLHCGLRVNDCTAGLSRHEWDSLINSSMKSLTVNNLRPLLNIICIEGVLNNFLYESNDERAKSLFGDIVNRCVKLVEESRKVEGIANSFVLKLCTVIRTALQSTSNPRKGTSVGELLLTLTSCPRLCHHLLSDSSNSISSDLLKFMERCSGNHCCRLPAATLLCKLITCCVPDVENLSAMNNPYSTASPEDKPIPLPPHLHKMVADPDHKHLLHAFLIQIMDNDCLAEEIVRNFLRWLSWKNAENNNFIVTRFARVLRFSPPTALQMVAIAFLDFLKAGSEFNRQYLDRILTELLENHSHFQRVCEKRAYVFLQLFNSILREVPDSELWFENSAVHQERFKDAVYWLKRIATTPERPQYWQRRIQYDNGFSNFRNPGYLLTRSTSVVELVAACELMIVDCKVSHTLDGNDTSDMSTESSRDVHNHDAMQVSD